MDDWLVLLVGGLVVKLSALMVRLVGRLSVGSQTVTLDGWLVWWLSGC